MSTPHYAVILAGGRGERFWPLSTSRHPKQLLSLVGDTPLLAQAVDRLEGLIEPDHVFVITNTDLVDASRRAAPSLPPGNVIGEPVGRDTAAAVALGAALVKARAPNGAFCILTADHIINDLPLYRDTLREGLALAHAQDVLLTIGIHPTKPATGYGYIESGEPVSHAGRIEFFRATRFVEKPDLATAEAYLSSGSYYWNAGMFMWSVASLEKAFGIHRPQLADLIATLVPAIQADALAPALEREYAALEKISIDYALMEKADNIVMAKGTFPWDDVGSWSALENHFDPDEDDNIRVGAAELLNSSGNIVISGNRLTALIGVSDLIVVQADGATLVCPKDKAQDVRKLVEQLRAAKQYDEIL